MVQSKLEAFSKILNPILLDSESSIIEYFKKDILNTDMIAVDLESDRNERFGHNLSLIQLGTRDIQFLVDPIALSGSEIFVEYMKMLLINKSIVKLFYSGMEDIQVLKREFETEIKNIYDVQYAYAFLQNSDLLTGLEKGVQITLKIELPTELHKYQRTDWSIRPLIDEMIWYAAFDVAFLIQLHDKYEIELKKDNHYHDYMRYFSSLELIEPVNEEIAELVRFLKMNDYNLLNNLEKLLAFRLHKFRIIKAKNINRPSHFILSKRDLAKIIESKPITVQEYKQLGIYRFKKDPNFKKDIVDIVKKTLQEFELDNELYNIEVKSIEDLILKLGKKDLHLVNKDLTVNLDLDIDVYKQRKYKLNQWRNEKAEKEHLRKDLVLSQFVINNLAKYNLETIDQLPEMPGIDNEFNNRYSEEILNLFK
jgi:ribonuclease D